MWAMRVLALFVVLVTLIPCSVLAQTSNETTCTEPRIPLEDGIQRHYRVGVLAIRGAERAYAEWNKTFNPYLTQTAGRMFDPPVTFSMEALDFVTLYTFVENKNVDFIYVNPSAFSCIESEYGASSLASLRNIRTVGENKYITTEFGGVVFTRSDRDDLTTLQDLKGRSFAAASISGLGSGQAQFRVLRQKGLHYLNDPAQAIFTSNQGAVVQMVEQGQVDFGFVRTDQIEGRVSRGLNEMETFKFIEAEYKQTASNERFPFPLTTTLYPEWNIGTLSHVDFRVQRAVQEALQAIPSDHEAAADGGYAGWQPTTSYMTLRDMQDELDFIQLDPADLKMKCIRSTTLYDSIICPQGYFKKSEEEVLNGCAAAGRECPEGMQCICRPCKAGFEVDVFEASSSSQDGCSKMSVCADTEQNVPVEFRFIDRLQRDGAQVSFFMHVGDGFQGDAAEMAAYTYGANITMETVGVHVIEIFLNGEQISQSPMLLSVQARDCERDFGGNSLREPDEEGACVCKGSAIEINNKCVEIWVVVISIALPLLFLLLCLGVYQNHRKKQSEAYWRVKFTDLQFDTPATILGRGTFGLVLKGEYRGTMVAVKKVLPGDAGKPKAGMASGGGSGARMFSATGTSSLSLTNIDSMHSMAVSKSSSLGAGASSFTTHAYENGLPGVTEEPEGGDMDTNGDKSMPPPSPLATHARPNPPNGSASTMFKAAGRKHSDKRLSFNEPMEDILPESDNLSDERADPFAAWRTNHTPGSMLWRSSPQNSFTAVAGSASGGSRSEGRSMWRCCMGAKDALHKDFLQEMAIIAKLRHPCITTVMGAVVEKGREPLLIMELMEHGSLYDLLRNETLDIDGEIILPIVRDIAQGMNFLHLSRPPIIHGDIKSQNVLVDMRFRAKVSDFGLTQKKKVGLHGTPFFMAPELLQGEENTTAADVYAFGILLCEVYSRREPYEGEDPRDVLAAVKDTTLHPPKRCLLPDACPDQLKEMVRQCWQNEKSKRPTFHQIDSQMKTFDASNVNPLTAVRQKQRTTEGLLYDVFPKHIADALAEGRKIEPESKDVVTIFFSDIVGFTTISSTVPPEKISNMLDRLYTTFDALSRQHGVFKVETIGDAYMAVTNLVEDQASDHAVRIARFSLAAIKAARETPVDLDDPSKGVVNIRVGFHSGPVVANVVGTRNPRYCLFGDTVNTASRMESNSIEGRIHMSQSAARCVRQQDKTLVIASRGWIQVKGKGDMKTYWLLGEADSRRGRLATPPPRPQGNGETVDRTLSNHSRTSIRSSSENSGDGNTIQWDGQSFARAPSLEQPLQMSEPPKVPEMAVPETIAEEGNGHANGAAAGVTGLTEERRRSLVEVLSNGNGAAQVSSDVVMVDVKKGDIVVHDPKQLT